jgi:hypothetical protein
MSAEALADDLAAQHVRWYRAHPTEQILQTCLIFPEEGDGQIVVACPWSDATERAFVLTTLQALMIREKAVRYALWSEVWMANLKVPPGTDLDHASEAANYQQGDLATHPDRVEAVFTLVVEASGKVAHRVQKIVRGRSGGVRTLVMMDAPDEFGSGALVSLLPPRTFN